MGLVLLSVSSLVVVSIVALVSCIVYVICKTYLARKRFERQSKWSLKFAPNFSPIYGHLKSFTFRSNVNNELARLHSQLGKSFCVMQGSQPLVVSIDLNLIKRVVLDEQQVHLSRGRFDCPIREQMVDNIFTARRADQCRRLRRAIAPALRANKFKTPDVEARIESSIDKFVSLIEWKLNNDKEMNETTLEADDYCHRYSLDLVLNCFYKQDNRVDFYACKDKLVQVIDRGLEATFYSPFSVVSAAFGFLNPLLYSAVKYLDPLGAWQQEVLRFIKVQTSQYIEAAKEGDKDRDITTTTTTTTGKKIILQDGSEYIRNDMVDYIIEQYLSGKLTWREYTHSSWFLFGAADKTSAEGITNVLYQLALNEDKQIKLRQEIQINGPNCDYLLWVINESMRLMPPAPLGATRQLEREVSVASDEGNKDIDDNTNTCRLIIPKGSIVMPPIYLIHRLKEYWGEDANEFKPERFAEQKSFHPCQFMPFGLGFKQCPGKEFAVYEMKLLLSKLLSKYKFTCKAKTAAGFDSPYFVFTLPHEPTYLTISRL